MLRSGVSNAQHLVVQAIALVQCLRDEPRLPRSAYKALNNNNNICSVLITFTDNSRPIGGFIPAESLVLTGTAGDNGTAGGTLNQPVLGFLVGLKPPLGRISSGSLFPHPRSQPKPRFTR